MIAAALPVFAEVRSRKQADFVTYRNELNIILRCAML